MTDTSNQSKTEPARALALDDHTRRKRRDRDVLKLEELDEETLKCILASNMPPGLTHLDNELPADWTSQVRLAQLAFVTPAAIMAAGGEPR